MIKILERVPAASLLHIAIPCYGPPNPLTLLSVVSGISALTAAGITWSMTVQPGIAYLDLVRDVLATIFYRKTKATDLLFYDNDLEVPIENFVRIARATKPLIGGVYRMKVDEVRFPIEFKQDRLWTDVEGDINDVGYIPTGFMRINRCVFDAMIEAAGGEEALEYETDDGNKWLNFFNAGVKLRNGKRSYIGEDIDFCRRWQELGGKVTLMPDLHFTHHGDKGYAGNWAEWMRDQNRETELRAAE